MDFGIACDIRHIYREYAANHRLCTRVSHQISLQISNSLLEPSTARDAMLPAELRVTEESAREAVEAEGAAIAEDAVRAMEGLPPIRDCATGHVVVGIRRG